MKPKTELKLGDEVGMICVLCGKNTNSPKGYMKHPVCQKCYQTKDKKYLESLKQDHPELYDLELKIMARRRRG